MRLCDSCETKAIDCPALNAEKKLKEMTEMTRDEICELVRKEKNNEE